MNRSKQWFNMQLNLFQQQCNKWQIITTQHAGTTLRTAVTLKPTQNERDKNKIRYMHMHMQFHIHYVNASSARHAIKTTFVGGNSLILATISTISAQFSKPLIAEKNVQSFPSLTAHRAALSPFPKALSQTPVFTL